MAIALVSGQNASSGDNNSVDSGDLAFPGSVSSGNLLLAVGAAWGSSAAPTSISVSDTLSTSYTTVLGAVGSGMTWRTFIAYGIASSSGSCTVTVNPSGSSSSFSFSIGEFSGVDTGTPIDADGGSTFEAGSTTTITDGITTASAGALIIGVMSHDWFNTSLTQDSPTSLLGENENNANNQCHCASYYVAGAAGAYSMNFTLGGSTTGRGCQSYAFKAATGGSSPTLAQIEHAKLRGGFRGILRGMRRSRTGRLWIPGWCPQAT